MEKLLKCDANYTSLSPIVFLKRASMFYSDRTSIIYEGTRFTWRQTYERCCRLASSLCNNLNIAKNDVVSVLAPNVPALYEMHFAVPMAGAILNTINTRLDVKNIALILQHSEAKILFVDYQYLQQAKHALHLLTLRSSPLPLIVLIDDIDSPTGANHGTNMEYEQLIHNGHTGFAPMPVHDEWDSITLNYTSGTTSAPKGVVSSHRGAFLSTLSLVMGWEMGNEPVYLWTLPMFHSNGWTFTWGIAARGGTNVCIRNTTAFHIYRSVNLHHVTHMCCALIVFNIILDAENNGKVGWPVNVLTGGAPPPAPLLQKMEALNFHVTHAYGLTEATGPALVCEWQQKWNILPADQQAKLKARQGISIVTLAEVDVKNMKTMESVPHDGLTLGEIVLRGSSIMKGYFKDPAATSAALKNGWFLTGDIGVIHPDGYLEIKDRSKDVIISGGENISSIELETVLYSHPQVAEAAVVAMPHPYWGESPCAFIGVRGGDQGSRVNETDLIAFCRKNMPHYMVPKKVVFVTELPKTSTGKIQKSKLREHAKLFGISDKHVTDENKSGDRQPDYVESALAVSRL